MARMIRGGVILALALGAALMGAWHIGATAGATTDGLTMIDEGVAAYYSPSYTGAGWERIRSITAANVGLDPAQVDDADKFFCVKVGYGISDIITLRNPANNRVATCRIADTNAPQDNAVWLSRFVVEVSWNTFVYLGLQNGNDVQVLVLPGG